MKLTDGKRTVEITMQEWDGSQWGPDWSLDFFEAGNLEYNEETNTYTVEDVDYCIEQANDWKYNTGDNADELEDFDPENRLVDVEEMLRIIDLLNVPDNCSRSFVDYYHGIIRNAITSIADDNTDFFESGLMEWMGFHPEKVPAEVLKRISDDGWDNCWMEVRETIQHAQAKENERIIYSDFAEAIEYYAMEYLLYDLGLREISKENWEEIQNFLFDITPDNKFEEITDFLKKMFPTEEI